MTTDPKTVHPTPLQPQQQQEPPGFTEELEPKPIPIRAPCPDAARAVIAAPHCGLDPRDRLPVARFPEGDVGGAVFGRLLELAAPAVSAREEKGLSGESVYGVIASTE